MPSEQQPARGQDRREGDRRQHQMDNLPFADRRKGNRRTGTDRRNSERN